MAINLLIFFKGNDTRTNESTRRKKIGVIHETRPIRPTMGPV